MKVNSRCLLLLLLVLTTGTTVFAGVPDSISPAVDDKGFVVGTQEGTASSSEGRGIFPNGDISGKFPGSFNTTSCTSLWWIVGSHTWKYRDYIVAGYNELYGKLSTSYGSATSACGPALIVDVIKVEGYGKGSNFNPSINKTAFNTDFVDDNSKINWVGSGGKICGAQVTHTATKSGVTWSSASASGC